MHSRVMKSFPFICSQLSVDCRISALVSYTYFFVHGRSSANSWSKVELLAFFDLTRGSPILPFTMGSVSILVKIANIGVVRVVARCLHCMAHSVGIVCPTIERG